jgi:sugar lactone lactonase YvrE
MAPIKSISLSVIGFIFVSIMHPVNADSIISTVVGDGIPAYSGDGGPAVNASLQYPYQGIEFDSNGNFYIGDTHNNVIRRVDGVSGIITTVVGNGSEGYSGDGGLAINAMLSKPAGIAFDNGGNLYFSDQFNNRVRRVDAGTGIITTVAGDGAFAYYGDGGPATSAALAHPVGVNFDSSGNLLIADPYNNRVRKVDSITGIITTIAGNGTAGYTGDGGLATAATLNSPEDFARDSLNNLYIAEVGNNVIRKIDTAGIITTVAGNGAAGYSGDGGPATSAQIYTPWDVAVDSNGNIFFAQAYNEVIRKVEATTGFITTVAGNGVYGFSGDGGPATSANLATPTGITVDGAGRLYISDTNNHRIRMVGTFFNFTGFFAPVNNPPVFNQVNAGRAIPVKFSLNGDQGLDIFASGYPKSQAIPCDLSAPVDPIETTVNAGSSSLSYDASIDTYAFAWKTEKAWTGCRRLIVKLKDDTEHLAYFNFR